MMTTSKSFDMFERAPIVHGFQVDFKWILMVMRSKSFDIVDRKQIFNGFQMDFDFAPPLFANNSDKNGDEEQRDLISLIVHQLSMDFKWILMVIRSKSFDIVDRKTIFNGFQVDFNGF